MLRKLMKYDFRSMWKQFAILWPVALLLALINRFTLPQAGQADGPLADLLTMVPMLVFTSVMIGMAVIALLFVIQRFYRGLLGDEGYLMHTLPVRPWQLISSKLTCAVAMTVISGAVAVLSVFLMMPITWQDFTGIFPPLGKLFQAYGGTVTLFLVEIILLILAGIASSYLHLYLAMALGHLASKHRVAMSALAYLGINVLGTVALNLLVFLRSPIDALMNLLPSDTFALTHAILWSLILASAVECILFFAITCRILGKNLNLE